MPHSPSWAVGLYPTVVSHASSFSPVRESRQKARESSQVVTSPNFCPVLSSGKFSMELIKSSNCFMLVFSIPDFNFEMLSKSITRTVATIFFREAHPAGGEVTVCQWNSSRGAFNRRIASSSDSSPLGSVNKTKVSIPASPYVAREEVFPAPAGPMISDDGAYKGSNGITPSLHHRGVLKVLVKGRSLGRVLERAARPFVVEIGSHPG